MTDDKRYNGWSNYETWCVNLWLTNEEGSDSYWRETAQEIFDESETETSFTKAERATLDLADRMKDEMEEGNPLCGQASLWSDMLSAALSEVNWYEIAEHFVSDCDFTESDEYDNAIDHPLPFLEDVLKHAASKEYPRASRSLARLDVKTAIAGVTAERFPESE